MKKLIVKLNQKFESLNDITRLIVVLFFYVLSMTIDHYTKTLFGILSFFLIFMFFRISYTFILWWDWKKKQKDN